MFSAAGKAARKGLRSRCGVFQHRKTRQARHVACGGLAGLVFEVHKVMVNHKINKFPGQFFVFAIFSLPFNSTLITSSFLIGTFKSSNCL